MDIAIVALVIIAFILVIKFIIEKRSKKFIGKSIDTSLLNDEIKTLLDGNKSILYFYTPTCGACKTQSPIIEKLKVDLHFVGKVDLSTNRATSTEFGILGTPSTAIMNGNKIVEIFVGFKQYKFLKTKFEAI